MGPEHKGDSEYHICFHSWIAPAPGESIMQTPLINSTWFDPGGGTKITEAGVNLGRLSTGIPAENCYV